MVWFAFSVLALLGLCLAWRLADWHPALRWGASGLLVVSLLGAWDAHHHWVEGRQQEATFHRQLPTEGGSSAHVTSDTCQSCHPSQHASWEASFHRTMTQFVSTEAVLPKFERQSLEYLGRPIELEWVGDALWASMDDPSWLYTTREHVLRQSDKPPLTQRFRLGLMTGSHHMQVFWIPSGEGNAQRIFPLCYLNEAKRWVPFKDTFLRDPLKSHYDQSWNANCINCHVTQGIVRPVSPVATQTSMAELGIACEACHGPAAKHVQLNRNPMRRYGFHGTEAADPTMVNPADLDHERASMVCGQCHGIHWIANMADYYRNGFRYRPGGLLDQNKKPVRATQLDKQPWVVEAIKEQPEFLHDRFWSDGMVRVSGRAFTGMMESPCYQKGNLSCLSCHQMHHPEPDSEAMHAWREDQLSHPNQSNQECLSCHKDIQQDLTAHTHHAPTSSGSECYNCHMPHTTYGLLKAIRSHQIDVPSIQNNLLTGRPNACNLCHLDRSLAWSADYLKQWYDQPTPLLKPEHEQRAASLNWLIKGDAGLRALAAWHYGWEPAKQASGTGWQVPLLATLLEDPYSAVRYIAARSLRSYEGMEQLSHDFIGSPEDWAQSRDHVTRKWRQMSSDGKGPRDPEKVLFKDATQLDLETLKQWQFERSNRSMDLQE